MIIKRNLGAEPCQICVSGVIVAQIEVIFALTLEKIRPPLKLTVVTEVPVQHPPTLRQEYPSRIEDLRMAGWWE